VCGEAEDGIQAVEQAKKANPDVVILNVVMPCLNGFEAAREIKQKILQAAIVILSTHVDRLFVDEARKIGIRAYVGKSKVRDALIRAIEAAIEGADCIVLD
jgi:DNA-binding NarL/FixJ family response regulator